MKMIPAKFRTIALLVLSVVFPWSWLCGQAGTDPLGFQWNPDTGQYEKRRANAMLTLDHSRNDRQVMTAHKAIWVMGTPQRPGHWERPRKGYIWVPATVSKKGHWAVSKSNEIEQRRKVVANFYHQVKYPKALAYPKHKDRRDFIVEAPEKPFRWDDLVPQYDNLTQNSKNIDFKGKTGRMNVHYLRKGHLGLYTFASDRDHIVVIDTLFVPAAGPLRSTFMSLDKNQRRYIKVVTDCLVFESPIALTSLGIRETDFVFAANRMLLKSPYRYLEKTALTPMPPYVQRKGNTFVYHYKDPMGTVEKVLLNRLYVEVLEHLRSSLNSESNIWEMDKLISRFQVYQYNKVNAEALNNDKEYQAKFNDLSKWFNTKYSGYKIQSIRDVEGVKVLASGNLTTPPIVPIQYYALPAVAKVLPVMHTTQGRPAALGTIGYRATGNARLRLHLDVELGLDTLVLNRTRKLLAHKKVTLQEKLSKHILKIPEQPLRVFGRVIGRIRPVDDHILRLEIDLEEETKTISELFPKNGNPSFELEVLIPGRAEPLRQPIALVPPQELLEQLDYTDPLESFNVFEATELTQTLRVTNHLGSGGSDTEGTLNYVELLLEFQFSNKKVVQGPFRLSPSNTLASELEVPFVRHNREYQVVVSGRAVYENGWRDCIPFAANTAIVVLQDAMFKGNQ